MPSRLLAAGAPSVIPVGASCIYEFTGADARCSNTVMLLHRHQESEAILPKLDALNTAM